MIFRRSPSSSTTQSLRRPFEAVRGGRGRIALSYAVHLMLGAAVLDERLLPHEVALVMMAIGAGLLLGILALVVGLILAVCFDKIGMAQAMVLLLQSFGKERSR